MRVQKLIRTVMVFLLFVFFFAEIGNMANAAIVQGTFQYSREGGGCQTAGVCKPISFAKVEIWNKGPNWWDVWVPVGTVETNVAGKFSYTDVRTGTYGVRVFATNYAARVWPDSDLVHLVPFYAEPGQPGPIINRNASSPNSVLDFSFDFTDSRIASHYNIAQTIRIAHDYASALRDPMETDIIPKADVQPTSITISSMYNPVDNKVIIESPYAFEDLLIVHEYSHFLEAQISSFAWIPADHYGCEARVAGNLINSPEHAWMEAFASYFALAVEKHVRNRPTEMLKWRLGYGTMSESYIEAPPFCNVSTGDAIEDYVAASLWDLLDSEPAPATDTTSEIEDFAKSMEAQIFQILDRELDTPGHWPTIWDFRNAWIGRGLDLPGLDRILSNNHILSLPKQTAEFIHQDVPTSMVAGGRYQVTFIMRNTGATKWESFYYKLGSQNPQDNSVWGVNRSSNSELAYDHNTGLSRPVFPGEEVIFSFFVTAPSTPGSYNFQWRMVQEGVEWFGDYTPNIEIFVYPQIVSGDPPPPSLGSDLVVQSIMTTPANPAPNQNVGVTITVKNEGRGDAGPFSTEFYRNRKMGDLICSFDPLKGIRTCRPILNPSDFSCPMSGGLKAGTTGICTGTAMYESEGYYTMETWVDEGDQVAEFNEENNVFSQDIQAIAVTQSYTLGISKTGGGSGNVTSFPEGVSCGSDCSEVYSRGTSVTLTATADAGSTFADWSGDPDCSDGEITLEEDKACTAVFVRDPFANSNGTYSSFSEGGYNAYAMFDVKSHGGVSSGSLAFTSSRTRRKVMSTGIDSLSVTGKTAVIAGPCTLNGVSGYSFIASVGDNATPGSGADTFSITMTGPNGFKYTASGTINSGDYIVSE